MATAVHAAANAGQPHAGATPASPRGDQQDADAGPCPTRATPSIAVPAMATVAAAPVSGP